MTYFKQGLFFSLVMGFLFGCSTEPGTGTPLGGGARTVFTYERGDVRVDLQVEGSNIRATAQLLDINEDTGKLQEATEIEQDVTVTWPSNLTLTLPDCGTAASLLNTESALTSKVFHYQYPSGCGATPTLTPVAQVSITVTKPSLPDRVINGGSSSTPNSTQSVSSVAASANQVAAGAIAFSQIDNAQSEDGRLASWASIMYGYSYYLNLTGYFTSSPLPDTAVIEGIKVNCKWQGVRNSGDDSYASTVRLMKAGVAVGNNKGSLTPLPLIFSLSSDYGGNSDLWGTTFTGSDINNGGFGLQLQIEGGLDVEAYIDFCKISVYWH